jgi:anti-sigma B factor antagonist
LPRLDRGDGVELGLIASKRDDWTVLAPVGDIDMQTAPELTRWLAGFESDDSGPIVVDLSDVDFLDSSALGALITAHRSLADAGRSLCVACPRPHISKIFRITRVTEVIDVFDTVDDALGR